MSNGDATKNVLITNVPTADEHSLAGNLVIASSGQPSGAGNMFARISQPSGANNMFALTSHAATLPTSQEVSPHPVASSLTTVAGMTGTAMPKPTIPTAAVMPPQVAATAPSITAHVTPQPTAPSTMVIPEVPQVTLTGITANAALQRAVEQAAPVMHPVQPTAPAPTVLPSMVQPVHVMPVSPAQPAVPRQIRFAESRVQCDGCSFTGPFQMSGLMPGGIHFQQQPIQPPWADLKKKLREHADKKKAEIKQEDKDRETKVREIDGWEAEGETALTNLPKTSGPDLIADFFKNQMDLVVSGLGDLPTGYSVDAGWKAVVDGEVVDLAISSSGVTELPSRFWCSGKEPSKLSFIASALAPDGVKIRCGVQVQMSGALKQFGKVFEPDRNFGTSSGDTKTAGGNLSSGMVQIETQQGQICDMLLCIFTIYRVGNPEARVYERKYCIHLAE